MSDELRRTAALIRERAEAVTPGPWATVALAVADWLDREAGQANYDYREPSKPAEPTELGTVVTDVDGRRWVKADDDDDRVWRNWRTPDGGVEWRLWSEIEVRGE